METHGQAVSHDNLRPDAWAIMQAGNLYAYSINNPVMWVDPDGLFIVKALVTAIIMVGIIAYKHVTKPPSASSRPVSTQIGRMVGNQSAVTRITGNNIVFGSNVKSGQRLSTQMTARVGLKGL